MFDEKKYIRYPLFFFKRFYQISRLVDKYFYGKKFFEKFGRLLFRFSLKSCWKHRYSCGPRLNIYSDKNSRQTILWNDERVLNIQNISSLKKKYTGPAYIVASGPSLNDYNLSNLADKVVFSVNGSIVKLKEAGVVPTFSVIVDPDFFRNRTEFVVESIKSRAICLFSSIGLSVILEKGVRCFDNEKTFLLDLLFKNYLQPTISKKSRLEWMNSQSWIFSSNSPIWEVGWSEDIEKGVFGGGTVVYAALQAACYMGYGPIYLLGVDMTSQGGKVRGYEESSSARPSFLDRDFDSVILPNFGLLKLYSQKTGFEVYNLSKNSRLPEEIVPKNPFIANLLKK